MPQIVLELFVTTTWTKHFNVAVIIIENRNESTTKFNDIKWYNKALYIPKLEINEDTNESLFNPLLDIEKIYDLLCNYNDLEMCSSNL